MREILFRGKSIIHGCWEYGDLITSLGRTYIGNTIGNHRDDWSEVQPESVGQFTGLLDKNGKKVFDGDIIKCYEFDPHEQRKVQLFKSSVVGCYQGSFYYFPNGNMKQPHQLLMYAYEPEIIGNIHDNPELI